MSRGEVWLLVGVFALGFFVAFLVLGAWAELSTPNDPLRDQCPSGKLWGDGPSRICAPVVTFP